MSAAPATPLSGTEAGTAEAPDIEGAPRHTSERFAFFKAWLAAPLRVASIVPSSTRLAAAMTREVSAATGPILELGPGTAVFTRALLARGVAEEDLVLVESGPEFIGTLRQQFPKATLLATDAAMLDAVRPFDAQKAGAAISGLPLLAMPARKVAAILHGVFGQMRAGGALYQFTYGPRSPVPRRLLDSLDLRAERICTVYANLPPASVYRITAR